MNAVRPTFSATAGLASVQDDTMLHDHRWSEVTRNCKVSTSIWHPRMLSLEGDKLANTLIDSQS